MENLGMVQQLLDQGNGMFIASQAAEAGLHRQQLANFVKAGILERPERGIYVEAGGMDDPLFWIQRRAQKIVYSHETALFLHRMTDRTPLRYSITVPSSYKASAALKSSCKIYYIKQGLIDLGKTEILSGMGHSVITYTVERTLCDVVRSRNKIDNQTVIDALKNYAKKKDKDLQCLFLYAKQFGVEKILYHYLEVLL